MRFAARSCFKFSKSVADLTAISILTWGVKKWIVNRLLNRHSRFFLTVSCPSDREKSEQSPSDVDRAAANAFIRYAAWVAFAALLNEEIARLNPQTD